MVVTTDESQEPGAILGQIAFRLSDYGICAVAVLVPDIEREGLRRPHVYWPLSYCEAAWSLAHSEAFGIEWTSSGSSLVAWTDTDRSDDWLIPWHNRGCLSLVRMAFELPRGRAIEIFVGSTRKLSKDDVGGVVRDLAASWPTIKKTVLVPLSGLSSQQFRVLQHAFDGLTAKETGTAMGVTERTVIHHLAAAQDRMGARNKIDTLRKAIWLGAL